MTHKIHLPCEVLDRFAQAVQTTRPVSGFTHNYYRYPARFSPQFAREAILAFSQPGDLVLDPFMGGGTTVVEALVAGRHVVGVDISPLGFLIAKAKISVLNEKGLGAVERWAQEIASKIRIGHKRGQSFWGSAGYQKDVPWPIRKVIEVIIERLSELPDANERLFARCILLKTAQWAIDCRKKTPSVEDFRSRFALNISEAAIGMREFRQALAGQKIQPWSLCLNRSAVGLERSEEIKQLPRKPRLVLTSPPYPGVQVLYHQWQVRSRRRTPAPFWIAGSLDGHGSAHYTFGHYQQMSLTKYFETALSAFSSIRSIVHDESMLIQLVGFSNPEEYLPRYLETMEKAGFEEVALDHIASGGIERLWRSVPNRKWYADTRRGVFASKEVVLAHRPAQKGASTWVSTTSPTYSGASSPQRHQRK